MNSNKNSRFYNNFFQKHTKPPTFFINQDGDGALVRRLKEFDSEQDVMEELDKTVELVNCIKERRHANTSGIIKSQRSKDIASIVKLLKNTDIKKQVKFSKEVICYKLICPKEIYFALHPKTIEIRESFDPPIRTLDVNLFCCCKKCRMRLSGCEKEACDQCFGKQVHRQGNDNM